MFRVTKFFQCVQGTVTQTFSESNNASNDGVDPWPPGGALATHVSSASQMPGPPNSIPTVAEADLTVIVLKIGSDFWNETEEVVEVVVKTTPVEIHYPSSLNPVGTSSCVHELPVDVFVLILQFLLASIPDLKQYRTTLQPDLGVGGNNGTDFWRDFMAVGRTCHRWREIIHRHFPTLPLPDLTNVKMVDGMVESMQGNLPENLVIADIHNSRLSRSTHILMTSLPSLILGPVYRHVRVLNVQREFNFKKHRHVWRYFGHAMPGLERLALTAPQDGAPQKIRQALFSDHVPALREITLNRCYLVATSPLLQNLTHLSLKYLQRASEKAVYRMLRAAPNVVSLDLHFLPRVESQQADYSLEFPALQRLHVSDWDALDTTVRFLRRLKAPPRVRIKISWYCIYLPRGEVPRIHAMLKVALSEWRRDMNADGGEEDVQDAEAYDTLQIYQRMFSVSQSSCPTYINPIY
ncbi:hypothetical protein HGRIS_012136 [Hohenbuehelia grisea]|uniref:F-box domain-containing protein n=1 Tax=Hohenbuehelia grisea TaxID=104357 RepID=A0ABR3IRD9_9AGAR